MIGKPERFGVSTPRRSRQSSTRAVCRAQHARAARRRGVSLTSKPASTVASEATGDGPEYRYGGAATLSRSLTSVGQAMKASSDE